MSSTKLQKQLKALQQDAVTTASDMGTFADFIAEDVSIQFAVKTARFATTAKGDKFQWSFELNCVSHSLKEEIGKCVWFNIGTELTRSDRKKRKDSYDLGTLLRACGLDSNKAMKLITDLKSLDAYLKDAVGKSIMADSVHNTDESGSVFQNFDNIVSV